MTPRFYSPDAARLLDHDCQSRDPVLLHRLNSSNCGLLVRSGTIIDDARSFCFELRADAADHTTRLSAASGVALLLDWPVGV